MARHVSKSEHPVANDPDDTVATPTPERSRACFVSLQDFYREATQREDIRRILAALANSPRTQDH